MAQVSDIGNATGTAASMCAISPSDEVGIVNNLLTRIEKLEQAVNMLAGVNFQAGRLSDLSQQVGWVYGVDYMGVPGWAQTEYGSLVPPPGFTLSGNGFQMLNTCTGQMEDYQGVSVDADGVIHFGFQTDGTVSGCKVSDWDAMSVTDIGLFQTTSGNTHGNPYRIQRGVSIYSETFGTLGAQIIFVVSTAGLYEVCGTAYFGTSIVNDGAIVVHGEINTYTAVGSGVSCGATAYSHTGGFISGVTDPDAPTVDGHDGLPGASISGVFDLPAGGEVMIDISAILDGGASVDSGGTVNNNFSCRYIGPSPS